MTDSGSWDLVSRQNQFSDLRSEWEGLFSVNPAHSPFQSWGWVDAWLRHLAGDHELRIVCHRNESGQLDFVLPLVRIPWAAPTADAAVMLACSYGPECSDHLGCLRAPSLERSFPEFFARAIEEFVSKDDVTLLEALNGAEDFSSRFENALREYSRLFRIRSDATCPVISLPGSWDAYTKSLSSNFRSQVRRFHRKVRRNDETRFRAVGVNDAKRFVSDLIRLNRSRMASKGDVSSLEIGAFRDFLENAVPYMAQAGLAWMDVVERNGEVVGTALNFAHGDSIYYYQGGFADSASSLRPGTALFAEVIRRAIDSGYARYDFLRGGEDYKYRWGAVDNHTQKVTIYPAGTARGLLARGIDDMKSSVRQLAKRSRRAINSRS